MNFSKIFGLCTISSAKGVEKMTQQADAAWVRSTLLREHNITPVDWESRIGSFPMKMYCPCEMWKHIWGPETQRKKGIKHIIAYYFQGVSWMVNVDQIESKKQEDYFNLMGVPRPVWQLLVAEKMVADGAFLVDINPDSTG